MAGPDLSAPDGPASGGSEHQTETDEVIPILTANLRPNGEKLLRAAIEIIDQGGVEALRVEHLVRQVGLTIPEIYRQFGSRQELVNAVQAERYVRSIAETRQLLDLVSEGASDAEEFRIMVNQVMWESLRPERLDNLWRRVNVLGSAYANHEMLDTISEIARTQHRAMVEVLQNARQRGWISAEADVAGAYSWFVAMVFGRVMAKLERRSPLYSERWTLAIMDVVNQELFGRNTPAVSEVSRPLPGSEKTAKP
jgi:AcrR family transcriptional regulator